jgi:PAS domain S-box-containing protein
MKDTPAKPLPTSAKKDVAPRHDRRRMNGELRESQRRYRELIRLLPAAIYTCDSRGRVELFNQAAVDLWGREPEAGETFWCGSWRIYRPDGSDLPLDRCPMALAIKEGRPVQGEIVIERPDGVRRNVLANANPSLDSQGSVTGAVNLLMDVTGQTEAEVAQSHLAAIVDSSDDAIVSKDLDGTIRSWNKGAERTFGYAESEMVGQPIAKIIPPELREEEREILAKLRRGERIEHFETVRVANDGHQLDVSLSISPIHNAAGEVVGASKIARDITESKRIARALAEADQRKDQFLAMLAHELRNPLAAVSSGMELLTVSRNRAQKTATRQMIGRQIKHLVHLVDDLLDMSRISRGIVMLRQDVLDARTLVERAVEAVRPLMDEQRHSLQVFVPDDALPLKGDATRLEQLLTNLLTNAAKYTPAGGRVRIEATRLNGKVEIAVRDNGIGISRDLLPQVFDLFAQSERSPDRASGGLGIGLTLVKAIAEMHGGSVEARSKGPGKGSEFYVRLPAVDAGESPEGGGTDPNSATDAGPSQRILVVDDNRDAAMAMAQLLEIAGHTVRQAHDGQSALETAAAFRPGVVLLDIGLPGLDGFEVAKRMRADPALEDVMLIAISGYCQEEDRRRSRKAGFDHHLAKPTELRELLALIADASR